MASCSLAIYVMKSHHGVRTGSAHGSRRNRFAIRQGPVLVEFMCDKDYAAGKMIFGKDSFGKFDILQRACGTILRIETFPVNSLCRQTAVHIGSFGGSFVLSLSSGQDTGALRVRFQKIGSGTDPRAHHPASDPAARDDDDRRRISG
jgi:hypothetical protein